MLPIIDNTVLANFALINRMDVLKESAGEHAIIPAQVKDEFEAGIKLGYFSNIDLAWANIESLVSSETIFMESLLNQLGVGEAACIALAHSRGGQVWTDDRFARLTCNQMKVPVSGTLGVLVKSIDDKILSLNDANQCLMQMIQKGYYSPVNRLDFLL